MELKLGLAIFSDKKWIGTIVQLPGAARGIK